MSLRVLYITNEDRRIGGSSLSLETLLSCVGDAVEPILLFRKAGPVRDHFAALGYKCLVVPYYRASFQASGFWRVLRWLPHVLCRAVTQCRCVRRVRHLVSPVDLVHTNSSTVDIGPRIARALGVPHVWHIREYADKGLGLRMFPSMDAWRRKLLSSDAVIAITPGLLEHLGIPGTVIPDAVLPASAVTLQLPKAPEVVFLAGTLAPHKHPDEAMVMFAISGLPEPYRLVLVGEVDVAYHLQLRDLAKALGVEKRIKFRPFVPDVRPLLSRAAAVLVCTEYEGMGRVAVEALFYGCPVIARNSGGSRDVLAPAVMPGTSSSVIPSESEESVYGTLYDNEDEGAAALAAVVASFPEAQVRAAADYAARTFATDTYGDRILSIYRSLL